MQLSPPLTVLGILAVVVVVLGLTATTATKDHPVSAQAPNRITVDLPTKTYNALALQVKDQKTTRGDTLTMAQWIADLTERTLAVPREAIQPRDAGPARDGRN